MNRLLPKATGTRWLEQGARGATIAQLRAALHKAVFLPQVQIDAKTEREAMFVLASYNDRVVTSLALTSKGVNEQDARHMKLVATTREKAGVPDWPKRARGRLREEPV